MWTDSVRLLAADFHQIDTARTSQKNGSFACPRTLLYCVLLRACSLMTRTHPCRSTPFSLTTRDVSPVTAAMFVLFVLTSLTTICFPASAGVVRNEVASATTALRSTTPRNRLHSQYGDDLHVRSLPSRGMRAVRESHLGQHFTLSLLSSTSRSRNAVGYSEQHRSWNCCEALIRKKRRLLIRLSALSTS